MNDEQSRVPVTEGDGSAHPLSGGTPARFSDQPFVETAQGLRMPKLGLGTYQLLGDECRDVVAAALQLGVRHIDTAQSYGNEAAVGEGLASSSVPRDDVFVTTKISDEHHSPADLVRSVEESLERLGTDHVDLLLVHWPVEWDIIAATVQTLAQVQASGMAYHIGVSNFTVEQLEDVQSFAPLEVLQVECHTFFQQRELRSWCARADWIFTAYSPLAKGAVLDDATLRDIADAHATSPATVALAWLIAQDHVVAIPRTTNESHLAANWAALSLQLSSDELQRIDALDEGRRLVDPAHAPW